MSINDIKTTIRRLVFANYNASLADTDDEDDTDLLSLKIIDSIEFVKLINGIEKAFNIEFGISELAIESFKSINLITEIVTNKLGLVKELK